MTPSQRRHWRAICQPEAEEHGSNGWAIIQLIDQVEALEANRAWAAAMLTKEEKYGRATLRSVAAALSGKPIHSGAGMNGKAIEGT